MLKRGHIEHNEMCPMSRSCDAGDVLFALCLLAPRLCYKSVVVYPVVEVIYI